MVAAQDLKDQFLCAKVQLILVPPSLSARAPLTTFAQATTLGQTTRPRPLYSAIIVNCFEKQFLKCFQFNSFAMLFSVKEHIINTAKVG